MQKDVRNEKNQQIMDLRSQVCHKLQEIRSIKVRHAIETSDFDLGCIINALKLRDMKNISDLAIFIEETKNKKLDVFRARLDELSAEEKGTAEATGQPEEESSQRTNTRKKEGNMDCNQISAQKVIDLTKTMDHLLPSVIKDLKKESQVGSQNPEGCNK